MACYDAHAEAIFRHCYFRVFNRERARELMQEAFTKTWECLTRGDEIRNLKAFVYRVANNLIIDNSRKKKEASLEVMQEVAGFDPVGDDASIQINAVDSELLLQLMKEMDPLYRDAVIMRYMDNLSPRDIAEITGETTNVISVRIHRGVAMVKKKLQNK